MIWYLNINGGEAGAARAAVKSEGKQVLNIAKTAVREASDIKIVPFKQGMDMGGGIKLYGNKGTAVLNYRIDADISVQIHHHTKGGGALDIVPSTKSVNPVRDKLEPDSRIELDWEDG